MPRTKEIDVVLRPIVMRVQNFTRQCLCAAQQMKPGPVNASG